MSDKFRDMWAIVHVPNCGYSEDGARPVEGFRYATERDNAFAMCHKGCRKTRVTEATTTNAGRKGMSVNWKTACEKAESLRADAIQERDALAAKLAEAEKVIEAAETHVAEPTVGFLFNFLCKKLAAYRSGSAATKGEK